MTKSSLWYLAALACGAAGTSLAPRPPEALPAVARALARPLLVSQLWNGIANAQRRGSGAEVAERARVLLRLLPEWGDGHVHFAAMLAFEASSSAQSPADALDRLAAAIAWLERSAAERPALATDLYAAIASFVEIRCQQDPALARAFAERFGRAAEVAADGWLARAEAIVPLRTLAQRRAWLGLRQIAAALRSEDDELAKALCELALARLAKAPPEHDLAEWRDALQRTRAVLAGGDPSELAGQPLLVQIAEALPARK